MTSPPERYSGVAAGVNSTFSRLGSLFAIAVLGLVVSLVFAARTDDPGLVPLALGERSASAGVAARAAPAHERGRPKRRHQRTPAGKS
jgi:hypothetical protein